MGDDEKGETERERETGREGRRSGVEVKRRGKKKGKRRKKDARTTGEMKCPMSKGDKKEKYRKKGRVGVFFSCFR